MSYITLNVWNQQILFKKLMKNLKEKKIELVEENSKYTYNNINFVGNTIKDMLEVKYD